VEVQLKSGNRLRAKFTWKEMISTRGETAEGP
jgi:hypothetical protein